MIRTSCELGALWFRSLLWKLQEALHELCPCSIYEDDL